MQSVYSTALANWAIWWYWKILLCRCSGLADMMFWPPKPCLTLVSLCDKDVFGGKLVCSSHTPFFSACLYKFFEQMLYTHLQHHNDTIIKTDAMTEHNCNILTPLLWPSRCVFLVLLICSTGGLGPTAGCWLSLLHLISIFSGPQTPSGYLRAPSVGCGFPYHISPLAVWNSTGNCSGSSNSTELYNRSIPTRSLKSNV